MTSRIRIGALISGGGTNLQAIIDACESGAVDGDMVFVGTDNPDAKGLERADRHGIPKCVVDYGGIIRRYKENPGGFVLPDDFDMAEALDRQTLIDTGKEPEKADLFLRTRAAAEAALITAMKPYPFDLLVLAGFMRNLTPYFIDRINTDPEKPRIMNIHPALLPAFPGTDGYGDTFRYGCKLGGCTVHFIDYGEDSGPIIGQRAFPIEDGDTLDQVKKNGLEEEWKLYPHCIQLFAQGRLETEWKAFDLGNGRVTGRTLVRINPL